MSGVVWNSVFLKQPTDFSQGTTGRPKGATLTHHNVVNNSLLVGDVIGYKEEEVNKRIHFYLNRLRFRLGNT